MGIFDEMRKHEEEERLLEQMKAEGRGMVTVNFTDMKDGIVTDIEGVMSNMQREALMAALVIDYCNKNDESPVRYLGKLAAHIILMQGGNQNGNK